LSSSSPSPLRLVHEVQTDDDAVGDLEHLEHEVEIALESRGVHDDDRHVGLSEQDEVARDLLVVARRQQRVRAGQIDELVAVVAQREPALGARHGLAGPVSGVLSETRECVEDGALAGVRVAGERDDEVPVLHVHAELDEVGQVVHRARRAIAVCGLAHDVAPASTGATWIRSACSRRSAISAPRTR
jgi:hypothetical protein